MAQLPVVRPFGEAHLRDQARLDPMRVAQPRSAPRRRGLPLVAGELLLQLPPLLRGEAGSHFAGELVPTLPVRDRQQECAQRPRRVALARRPSHDRQLLRRLRLELQPFARAALFIDGATRLEDQPFQPALPHPLQRFVDVARHLFSQPHLGRSVGEDAAQQVSPFLQWAAAQVLSVEPQQVESEQHGLVHTALLDELEPRYALRVENADLAVDHGVADDDARERPRDPREPLAQIESVARPHRHPAVRQRAERPIAIVLHLRVPIARRRRIDERREHRRQVPAQDRVGRRSRRAQLPAPFGTARGNPAAHHRLRPLRHDVIRRVLLAILRLEHQPLRLAGCVAVGAHQVPLSLQLLAVELDDDVAFLPLLGKLSWRNRVAGAVVPDQRVAGPVFAVRDPPFEAAVLEGMILGLDGEALDRRVVAGPLRHRPRCERAVHLQADVVVEPRGVMLVHDEGGLGVRDDRARRGLRRHGEVAPRLVFGELLSQRSAPRACRRALAGRAACARHVRTVGMGQRGG